MSNAPQWKVVSNIGTGFWEVHDSAGFLCKLESESTAQLIAAAPKLLSAFVDLLDQLEAAGIYIPGQDEGQWADAAGLSFRRAEAAVAKAEGRAE